MFCSLRLWQTPGLRYHRQYGLGRVDVSVYSAMFGLRLYMLCVILRSSTWTMCHRVLCAGGCRHERAHRLMASMGLSRLDDLSLWTQYSRTAGDTASSSSLTSPRLFELFQVIAFCLYITWALSLAIVVEWILFRLPSCSSGQSGCVRPRSTCLMIWRWFEVVT